eukprot:Hpha_TRINITY_DN15882_c1_g6::TRINITY_DN15882_c1_g6_i1::g.189240::m.189240
MADEEKAESPPADPPPDPPVPREGAPPPPHAGYEERDPAPQSGTSAELDARPPPPPDSGGRSFVPSSTEPTHRRPYSTAIRQGRFHMDTGTARPVMAQTIPSAMKVHPRGFRVLSRVSPIERALTSYFRLPPEPTMTDRKDKERVQRLLHLRAKPKEAKRELDGFMLLEACGVEDPEDAVEATISQGRLTGAVQDDLVFFTGLEFLDVGETGLEMQALAPLEALEELHLHCSGLTGIDLPQGSFRKLDTLNLSFNRLESSSLTALLSLPSLVRVDLSANELSSLPSEFSQLTSLRQLALENNKFEREVLFHTLGSLRSLEEVNLNKNPLRKAPKLDEDAFPSLRVLGLAECRFEFFEDLFSLTGWGRSKGRGGLHRVALWGNPIERRSHDLDILCYELGAFDIQVLLDSPVPPKRSVGKFYVASTKNLRKISLISSGKRAGKLQQRVVSSEAPPVQPVVSAATGQQEEGPGPDSFFVTQGAGVEYSRGDAVAAPSVYDSGGGATREHGESSWFALQEAARAELNREVEELIMQHGTPSPNVVDGAVTPDGERIPGGLPVRAPARRQRTPGRPASRRGIPNPPTLRAAHMLLREALAHPITQPVAQAAARQKGRKRPTPGKFTNIYAQVGGIARGQESPADVVRGTPYGGVSRSQTETPRSGRFPQLQASPQTGTTRSPF